MPSGKPERKEGDISENEDSKKRTASPAVEDEGSDRGDPPIFVHPQNSCTLTYF